ncbi:hypothetical protein HDU96_001426 [Phlyctochytrium bullatum]|nr:hypothetical protein HDU96_001426 [Phlyctochytrium bullatum]
MKNLGDMKVTLRGVARWRYRRYGRLGYRHHIDDLSALRWPLESCRRHRPSTPPPPVPPSRPPRPRSPSCTTFAGLHRFVPLALPSPGPIIANLRGLRAFRSHISSPICSGATAPTYLDNPIGTHSPSAASSSHHHHILAQRSGIPRIRPAIVETGPAAPSNAKRGRRRHIRQGAAHFSSRNDTPSLVVGELRIMNDTGYQHR